MRERENRRAYDEWRQTDGQRRDGGLLLVASGTTTTQHTHAQQDRTGLQRTQRRQTGSILESDLAGWCLDDDIRTTHDRVHCAEQTASLAPKLE